MSKEGQRIVPGMRPKKKKVRNEEVEVEVVGSKNDSTSGRASSKVVGTTTTLMSALALTTPIPVTVGNVQPTVDDSSKLRNKIQAQSDDPKVVAPTPVKMSEAEKHSKMMQAMQDGMSDQQLAIKFEMDLASILRARKEFLKNSKMNSPRALFSKRLSDIDEAFDAVRDRFFDDPGNEVYVKAMNDFARTLRELVQSYNDLEDPKEIATTIVVRVLRPFLMEMLKPVVESLDNMQTEMSTFLPEHTRAMIETSVLGAVRKMQTQTSIEFNKAVSTVSTIYQVDLQELRITNSAKLSETPIKE